MKAQWLVAKYIPDLIRREPINVGVVLFCNGTIHSRFHGQRSDGVINGNAVRGWVHDLQSYRSWVASWTYALSKGWDVARLTRRSNDQNYFLEFSGEQILSDGVTDSSALLAQLYSVLVESPRDAVVSVSQLSEQIFRNLNIFDRVDRPFKLDIPSEDISDGGRLYDEVFFDYKYDNSARNLFKEVSISPNVSKTWSHVHAAAWSFIQMSAHSKRRAEAPSQFIALVKPIDTGDIAVDSQLGLLRKHAVIVNVNEEDAATNKLAQLLHVRA